MLKYIRVITILERISEVRENSWLLLTKRAVEKNFLKMLLRSTEKITTKNVSLKSFASFVISMELNTFNKQMSNQRIDHSNTVDAICYVYLIC